MGSSSKADSTGRGRRPACQAVPADRREVWDLWLDEARSPALNMAIDDLLLQTAAERGRPLVRLYQWDRACVSFGCLQDWQAVAAAPAAVRRPTGGGVVDHAADVTYSAAVAAGHWLLRLEREDSYACFNRAVVRGLATLGLTAQLTGDRIPAAVDRRTMACFTHPTRYDVMLGPVKVAGAAQRRRREGLLHQGSILLTPLGGATREQVAEALLAALAAELAADLRPFQPDDAWLAQARALAADLYATPAWNRRR